jgi:hypothetical protein
MSAGKSRYEANLADDPQKCRYQNYVEEQWPRSRLKIESQWSQNGRGGNTAGGFGLAKPRVVGLVHVHAECFKERFVAGYQER